MEGLVSGLGGGVGRGGGRGGGVGGERGVSVWVRVSVEVGAVGLVSGFSGEVGGGGGGGGGKGGGGDGGRGAVVVVALVVGTSGLFRCRFCCCAGSRCRCVGRGRCVRALPRWRARLLPWSSARQPRLGTGGSLPSQRELAHGRARSNALGCLSKDRSTRDWGTLRAHSLDCSAAVGPNQSDRYALTRLALQSASACAVRGGL